MGLLGSVCLYVHACMHVCMYACMYVCMHVHCMYVDLYVYQLSSEYQEPVSPILTLESWGCNNEAVRLSCGPSDITQHRCEEYGCCFDNSQQPACFHSDMNGNKLTYWYISNAK